MGDRSAYPFHTPSAYAARDVERIRRRMQASRPMRRSTDRTRAARWTVCYLLPLTLGYMVHLAW